MINRIKYALWKIKSLWKDKRDDYAFDNWRHTELDFAYDNNLVHNTHWIAYHLTTPECVCKIIKGVPDNEIRAIRIYEGNQRIRYEFHKRQGKPITSIMDYCVTYQDSVIPGTYLTMDWNTEDNHISYSLQFTVDEGWQCVCDDNYAGTHTLFSGVETFMVHLLVLISNKQVVLNKATRDIINCGIGHTDARYSR